MNKRGHFKFCRKLLYDEISNKHKNLKELQKQQQESQNLLKNVVTWMKQKRITYSINCIISKYVAEVTSRHARKCNCLLNKNNAENGIQSNPNNVVWNLSSRSLANEEYDVLSYGLNLGLATNLSCNDVLPSMESVWDQLTRNNFLKENYHSINRAKKSPRAIAFNLINLDNQKVFKDKRKLQIIKELCKDTVVLKPDKGNGVVAIDMTDYYKSLDKLFSDKTKFKRLDADSTSIQRTGGIVFCI